jgi:hypothetical protein
MLQAISGDCFGSRAQLSWSLISSAPALSAFAGVLAGFMFTAMVLLFTRELKEYSRGRVTMGVDPGIGRPITFMFASFFSLIMAAFLFASMTGEDAYKSDARQFIEGTLPSIVLTLGVVQMAVGLDWLVRARELGGTPALLARLVAPATISLAAIFPTGVVISPLFQHLANLAYGLDTRVAWFVLVAVVAAAIPLGILMRRPLLRRLGIERLVIAGTVGTGAMTILAAVGWVILSATPECDVYPLYASAWGNLLTLAAFVVVMLVLATLLVAAPVYRRRP